MLNLLLLDRKYIAYTLDIKRYLLKFLFGRKPFPLQIGEAVFMIEPRSSDLFTIYEIFIDRGYLPKLPKFPKLVNTVVDLGANIGVFSVWASSVFRPKSVVAVEMEPACYHQLVENIALNHLEDTVWPFQGAIFSYSGAVGTRKIPGSNYYEVAPHKSTHRVKSFSFRDFLKVTGLDRVDLLKIDIEGAEKYLLTEENASLFKRCIRYILLETHSLNDFKSEQAAAYLSSLGFRLTLTRTPYKWDRNYIIDAWNPS